MANPVSVVPALGASLLLSQTGPSAGYNAWDDRRQFPDLLLAGEGVATYESFRVQQRGAGANLSVDVGMDERAWIRGDSIALQGSYVVPPSAATLNVAVPAADASNPRLDLVILEALDDSHDAGGLNGARVRVVAGTATSGATLDNRSGAAALPASSLHLADVIVGISDTSITTAEIRDRRAFVAGIPPLLTDVDMARFDPLWSPSLQPLVRLTIGVDLQQGAYLARLDRRIVSATRLRWKYRHANPAGVGNYVIGIYDASGRKIVDTGSVALTGAADTYQVRSETITATTFEPGYYYVLLGNDMVSGQIEYQGLHADVTNGGFNESGPPVPNMMLRSATGGVTAPSTILGFTDLYGATSATSSPAVPFLAVSVG